MFSDPYVCTIVITHAIYSINIVYTKIDHHDITEILLKVALNTIKQTKKQPIQDENVSDYNYRSSRRREHIEIPLSIE